MNIDVIEESPSRLVDYAGVSIAFCVTEVFEPSAIAALRRGEPAAATRISTPYWKDYDGYAGGNPADWAARFPRAAWSVLAAYRNGKRVGGAALVVHDPELDLLQARPDTVLLWDLRVAPDSRHQGVGRILLENVEAAASRHGAREVLVETQQINVPACRLYQQNGFDLVDARPHAYAAFAGEIQLLWSKTLKLPSR